jgi:glutamate--cysteine ligase
MKEVYRLGLGHRYGRLMQAISGVHFNYSFPAGFWEVLAHALQAKRADQDFISNQYFALLRNYRRHGWLILYLFGNSPALCSSFVKGREHTLKELSPGTLYEPYATSLRMSDLGYRNKNQAGVQISVNSLARSFGGGQHPARGVSENRREGRWRIPPVECKPVADRERVLQLHPAEARRAFR